MDEVGVPPLLQQRGQLVRLVTPLVVRHVSLFQALDRLAQALCGQLVLFQTLVALAFTFPQLYTQSQIFACVNNLVLSF